METPLSVFKYACVAMAAFMIVFSAPTFAQDLETENRLRRLENEISTLSQSVYRGESPPTNAYSRARDAATQAGLEVRLQQLETELRTLTGRLEQQSYQTRTLSEKLDRVTGDLAVRLGDVEKKASASSMPARSRPIIQPAQTARTAPTIPAPAAVQGQPLSIQSRPTYTTRTLGQIPAETTPSATILPTQSTSSADPIAEAYENAFALLKAGNYKQSEVAFQGFINQYPKHALVPNAKYWLGESFYVRRQYERAARIFAEGYQSYPKSSKAPDNLLKLGLSLGGMGNTHDACVALAQLKKEYASERTPVMRRADQEFSRLGCG